MGQALRRTAGRLRTTTIDSSSSSASPFPNSLDHKSPSLPNDIKVPFKLNDDGKSDDNAQRLEESDPSEVKDSNYEAMLNQMVGRISTKPGGKLEMGEAFVVRKSNRAMPKLRNTSPDTGRYEERPVSVGTLNVAQLRHILLLHQGKADGHDGPVDPKEIAGSFRLDPVQVEKILNFVSMPAVDNSKQKPNELDD